MLTATTPPKSFLSCPTFHSHSNCIVWWNEGHLLSAATREELDTLLSQLVAFQASMKASYEDKTLGWSFWQQLNPAMKSAIGAVENEIGVRHANERN